MRSLAWHAHSAPPHLILREGGAGGRVAPVSCCTGACKYLLSQFLPQHMPAKPWLNLQAQRSRGGLGVVYQHDALFRLPAIPFPGTCAVGLVCALCNTHTKTPARVCMRALSWVRCCGIMLAAVLPGPVRSLNSAHCVYAFCESVATTTTMSPTSTSLTTSTPFTNRIYDMCTCMHTYARMHVQTNANTHTANTTKRPELAR